mmetsp:Transcript_8563/g.28334  ORF Transcript_8563/g.28334 Transcript_8563/m.28334 type:complete len:263 (+) Transcript_8563:931-1719(+)
MRRNVSDAASALRSASISTARPPRSSVSGSTASKPSKSYSCGCGVYGEPSEPTPTGTSTAPQCSRTARASFARCSAWPPPLHTTPRSSTSPRRWRHAAATTTLTSSGSGPGSVTTRRRSFSLAAPPEHACRSSASASAQPRPGLPQPGDGFRVASASSEWESRDHAELSDEHVVRSSRPAPSPLGWGESEPHRPCTARSLRCARRQQRRPHVQCWPPSEGTLLSDRRLARAERAGDARRSLTTVDTTTERRFSSTAAALHLP